MENISEKERVRQNLVDAGCDSVTISDFFGIDGTDKSKKQMTLLRNHRKKLLNNIHKAQKEIDCLDYLIFQIEKRTD